MEQLWEERQKPKKGPTKAQLLEAQGKSKGAMAEEYAKAAEEDITEQLFATDIQVDSKGLSSQKAYESFAKQVSDILYAGEAPWNIPQFYSELSKGL